MSAHPDHAHGPAEDSDDEECLLRLEEIQACFEGAIPAVIATSAADGTPNVTYLSRALMVDGERVALSNQFFSKTARNLAENPRASLLLIDPIDFRQFRLMLVYERTERRGPVFERLREDVDMIAALTHMQDVFKLRSADIYRVLELEQIVREMPADTAGTTARPSIPAEQSAVRLAELAGRLGRCPDLDTLVSATLAGLDDLLGYRHSVLLLLDEEGQHLYTIGSHGYPATGVGSEVTIGDGAAGLAAERCSAVRLGGIRQMEKYARSVRSAFETQGYEGGREIPVPDLEGVESQLAVPAQALGQLVGVLMVESTHPVAFTALDEARLGVIASIVANAIEAERPGSEADAPTGAPEATAASTASTTGASTTTAASAPAAAVGSGSVGAGAAATHVKFYAVDGSTFVDGDYLIKGVAGRILWSVLSHHDQDGRVDFTMKEVRLDLAGELPQFRDNLDSRLLLLTRRLEDRDGTIRLAKTGRGRFRLELTTPVRLEVVETA